MKFTVVTAFFILSSTVRAEGLDTVVADFLERVEPFLLSKLDRNEPDPSNRFSGNPDAVELGKRLFFDVNMSAYGTISCATCHVTDGEFIPNESHRAGFDRKFRPVMPVIGAQYQSFLFWDGRADSLWMQALGPIENPTEHNLTRTEAVAKLTSGYRDELETILGISIDQVQERRASPIGDAEAREEWASLKAEEQHVINELYATLGKMIAAFEEQIPIYPSKWDEWVAATIDDPAAYFDIPTDVIDGFNLFTGKGRCATCHTGPLYTDMDFHNTGLPALDGMPPDLGRQASVLGLLTDPFNCTGPFSDVDESGCPELRFMNISAERTFGTFRTPSLRDVGHRSYLGHAGQIRGIAEMVDHYNQAPAGPYGAMLGQGPLTELVPLNLTEDEMAALIAFLEAI